MEVCVVCVWVIANEIDWPNFLNMQNNKSTKVVDDTSNLNDTNTHTHMLDLLNNNTYKCECEWMWHKVNARKFTHVVHTNAIDLRNSHFHNTLIWEARIMSTPLPAFLLLPSIRQPDEHSFAASYSIVMTI